MTIEYYLLKLYSEYDSLMKNYEQERPGPAAFGLMIVSHQPGSRGGIFVWLNLVTMPNIGTIKAQLRYILLLSPPFIPVRYIYTVRILITLFTFLVLRVL